MKQMMVFPVVLLVCMMASTGYARGKYKLVDLEKAEFEYGKFDPHTRDPYVPEYTGYWKERTAVNFRMATLGGIIYWDNRVHGETVETGVFKTVGWQWELGLRVTDQLVIFHQHHSKHVMEQEPERRFNAGSHFPVDDVTGIKLILIKETTGRGIL